MRYMMRSLVGLSAAFLLTGAAVAQDAATADATACTVPTPPVVERPVKPSRPSIPSCVNEARGTHTCRRSVIAEYEAEMEGYGARFNTYIEQVNAYIAKLNGYSVQAVAYAECEQRIVAPRAFITG